MTPGKELPGTDPMARSSRPPVSRGFLEVVASSFLLLWRIWTCPPRQLVQDVTAVLAAYWLLVCLAGRSKLYRPITLTVMAGLLLIYCLGQVPAALSLWAHRP